MTEQVRSLDTLLAEAERLYPGVRIGRPGQARTYWPTIMALRLLRAAYAVEFVGLDHVAPGAAILIGNHTSGMDPVAVVMSTRWRVSAFTKIEAFEGPGGIFFRVMGQIPLRRGDDESTEWAMEAARATLAAGGKIGVYPEGTRSPVPDTLHRLHKRVLIPVLQANPTVPVHAVTTRYAKRRGLRRTRVRITVSPPLTLDVATASPQVIADRVRDALLETGGLAYVDRYARDVKAELRAARSSSGKGSGRGTQPPRP